MKLGIISDTHGMKEDIDRAIEVLKGCDKIFHLGDYKKDVDYIRNIYSGDIISIKGNCDTFNVLEKELIYKIDNKKIFLTHGDYYGVNNNIFRLKYRAMELEANIVLYGHTHISNIELEENIYFINPGSCSKPRDGYKSVAVIEINNNNINSKIIKL